MEEKKKLRRSCVGGYSGCVGIGIAGEEVTWMACPFAAEIYEEIVMGWWCDVCSWESYMDT